VPDGDIAHILSFSGVLLPSTLQVCRECTNQ